MVKLSEREPLKKQGVGGPGLSLGIATVCIIDLFGVFPIIALPRAIVECGWLGLPLAVLVFALQVYTAILLGRCWVMAGNIEPAIVEKSRYPYAALANLAFGRRSSQMVTILLDATIFGGGVPNLIVASQNLQLLGLKVSNYQFDFSYCYWLLVIGLLLCPAMWLGSPKDMKWLTVSSVFVVTLVAVLTWLCLMREDLTEGPTIPSPTWETVAIAYGILAFQFDIHPMILTVQVDMADKNNLGKAILAGFTVSGSLFLTTCVIAYFRYGAQLEYNILQGLPASGYLYGNVLLVTLQICLSSVVGSTALFQDVEDKLGISREFSWRRCAARSAIVVMAVAIAESVPRFDLIMGLIGGSMTGPLMFVLPPLIYARLRAMHPLPPPPAPVAYQRLYPSLPTERRRETQVHVGMAWPPDRTTYGTAHVHVIWEEATHPDTKHAEDPIDYWLEQTRERAAELKASFLESLSLQKCSADGPLTLAEQLVTAGIVLAGVLATVLSTYYSLRGAIRYANFTPSCLVNVTVASRFVSEQT